MHLAIISKDFLVGDRIPCVPGTLKYWAMAWLELEALLGARVHSIWRTEHNGATEYLRGGAEFSATGNRSGIKERKLHN